MTHSDEANKSNRLRSVERLTEAAYARRRSVIAITLALIIIVSAGVVMLETETTFEEVTVGSDEERALDEIEANFETDGDRTYAQLVLEADNALDREVLLTSLELQQEIRDHEAIAPTLAPTDETIGLANLIATAVAEERGVDGEATSLADQREIIDSMSQAEIDAAVDALLAGPHGDEVLQFLPNDHDGSGAPEATMIVVAHTADPDLSSGAASDELVEAQLAMTSLDVDTGVELNVVGQGLLTDEMDQSTADTLSLLGPLSLVVVLLILTLAYRRVLDIGLSLVGILLVLLWTFGALGWMGVAFNPILIAIPVFLIGMSIDFGIHVFMRYRERHGGTTDSHSGAMAAALAGVGVAMLWITITTVTGFLSNLVSPMQPIRELGLMAAVGILGAFVIFVGLLPAVKVELERYLGSGRSDGAGRAVGTGTGRTGAVLAAVSSVATRAPIVIIVAALLVTAGASAVALGVDTSYDHEDNIADGAPAWAEELPGPLAPGEYTVKDSLQLVNEQFVRDGSTGEVLIDGDVTDPAVLQRIDGAIDESAETETVVTLANGEPVTNDPLSVMHTLAAEEPAFAELIEAADTTGDGIPDRNLEGIYDAMYELAPERTAAVVHRSDDGYESIRVSIAVSELVDDGTVTDDLRTVADGIEDDRTSVTATGDPVTHHVIEQHIIQTVIVSLFVTLLVVGVLLMGVFRAVHGSATLGLVTLLPVAFAVAWIIATVDLLGYSLDVVTALTASLTIGIGIDYSIHVSERFRAELDRARTTAAAIRTTLRGTGGALLASAATTAAGFGVLGLAINPMLQQFGLITAIMIAFAFIGAVVLLPAMLVVWAKVMCVDPSLACAVGTEDSVQPAD